MDCTGRRTELSQNEIVVSINKKCRGKANVVCFARVGGITMFGINVNDGQSR